MSLRMCEHIYLSSPRCKSKNCKIGRRKKGKPIEIHCHVAQERKTKHDKDCMARYTVGKKMIVQKKKKKKNPLESVSFLIYSLSHRRTGPFPLGGGGGGHTIFGPNFSSLPEKSNMFGQCIFPDMGGGGGGKEGSSF